MAKHVPSHQLELANVPSANAGGTDVIRFAQTYNGYFAAGDDGIRDVLQRFETEGTPGFSLDELRLTLFARQRAHYHQGGPWPGETDTLMEEMRALVARIRQRVAAGEHLVGASPWPEIRIWTGDITTFNANAIVNAANESLLGGGGVDGAIHRAAGPKLLAECREIVELSPGVRCPAGQALLSWGYDLPARRVIHAVGPRWQGGAHGECDVLASAYRSILGLAEAHQLGSIAVPAISTGIYGFPADEAARIAVDTIRAWEDRSAPWLVTLVGYDERASAILRAALES